MAEVFISYARADHAVAVQIHRKLESSGYQVTDDADVPPGVDWREHVQDQIKRASVVVSIWSKGAARSEWMRADPQSMAIGAWANGTLLLLRLDDTELPAGLNDLSAMRLSVDESGRITKGLPELLSEVRDRLRQAVPPEATPAMERAPATIGGPAPQASARAPAPTPAPHEAPRASGGLATIATGALGAVLAIMATWLLTSRKGGEPVSYPPPPSWDSGPSIPWGLILSVLGTVAFAYTFWAWWRGRRDDKEKSAADASQAPAGARDNAAGQSPARAPADPAIDVFVSYSRIDSGHVNRLVDELRAQGLRVWIDTAQQSSEARYAGPIVRAIRACRSVVLMCSQNSFRSDHVVREVYVSGDAKKHFIAVQLDTSELPDDFTYFLSGFPRLSLSEFDPPRLASRVRELLPA